MKLSTLLGRLAPRRPTEQPYEQATLEDLHYCYRLLLRREPDPDGWAYWSDLIINYHVDLPMLVGSFLSGEEFRSLQEEDFRPVLIELDGFKMFVRKNDFFIGAVIARERQYEQHVHAELGRQLGSGSVLVDIGANIGYFTLLGASLVGPDGRVYSFEPHPANCALIEASVEANGFGNVALYPYAVADRKMKVRLDGGGADSNSRIVELLGETKSDSSSSLLVETVVLDEVLDQVPRVDVIKMDIEGAEPKAWQGMLYTIDRHRPMLIFEFSPRLIQLTSAVSPISLLESIVGGGYRLSILPRQGGTVPIPSSPEEIVKQQAESGLTHLDLAAYPE